MDTDASGQKTDIDTPKRVPERKPIENYALMGVSYDEARPMHELCLDIREQLPSDHALQDVVLGWRHHGEYIDSWSGVQGYAWHRATVDISLSYLELVRGLARGPGIMTIGEGVVTATDYATFEPPVRIDGFDAAAILELQQWWVDAPDAVRAIESYHSALESAWDAFNLQSALTLASDGTNANMEFDYPEYEQWRHHLTVEWSPTCYVPLDSAYYSEAKRQMHACGIAYQASAGHQGADLFLLTQQQVTETVSQMRRDQYF